MRKPTNFQRLLREKTLHRYLMAVESVDLAAIEQIWQQATHDDLLEYMLLEAHEAYLDQETSALQEEIPMDFKEGVHKSLPQEELDELKAAQGAPAPQPNRYARWLQVLAAIVLIALLSGGVLLYTRLHPTNSTAHNTQVNYKWCVTSGPASDHPPLIPNLTSIAAIAPDNIWAVGNESSRGSIYDYPSVPLIEHWDGTQWSIVPEADTTALYQSLVQRLTGVPSSKITEATALNSISAVSANDIWAIGSISANGPSSSVSHTLIEHWDGQQWQLIAGPNVKPAVGTMSLNSIAAVAANDVWAVGFINPPVSSSSGSTSQPTNVLPQPVVEHWNGSGWSAVTLPGVSKTQFFESVTATAPDNVWILGEATEEGGSIPLAAHWDGQNWQVIAPPKQFSLFFGLKVAPTSSAHDLWITGEAQQTDGTNQPVVAHWNGQQWSDVAGLKNVKAIVPANLQTQNEKASGLNAIAMNNPHDVWVAGQTAAGKTLIEHWDGRNWNIASQQLPSPGEINGLALSAGKVWVVGDRYDNHAQTSKGALIAMSC